MRRSAQNGTGQGGIGNEEASPTAEQFARSLGLYEAFILAQSIVREIFPAMTALAINVQADPEEEEHSTICFMITIPTLNDCVVNLDDALQDMLYERMPSDALLYFSFTYCFE